MTLKEQIVRLSNDTPLRHMPTTIREEIVFLAEDHLGQEISNRKYTSGNISKEPE